LGAVFDRSRNSLNLLRLLLAASVVIAHSWTLARGGEVQFGHAELGAVAVDAFFVVSGYLIAGSCAGLPTGRYLWNRIIRIFPAYGACLLLTAFVAAPIAWNHDHHTLSGFMRAPDGPFKYVLNNADLNVSIWDVAGTPAHVAYPGVWDGSLWTLRWEFECYIAIALMGAISDDAGITPPVGCAARVDDKSSGTQSTPDPIRSV